MRLLLALSILFLALPALADDLCDGDRGALDDKIAACSARISNPSTTAHNRGAALINRGNANRSAALMHTVRRSEDYVFGKNQGQADAFETEHIDAAIRDFDQAIAIFGETPDGGIAYNDRGNAYGDKGDHAQAIRDYTTAIRLKPDYAGSYSNRGVAYAQERDYDKAIADFDRAVAMQPNNADYVSHRADAYKDAGQEERAIADYDRVLRIDPANKGAEWGKKFILDARKTRDDDMVQHCLDVRRQPSGEVAFGNHCRFDVKAKTTNAKEPIFEVGAGATKTRRLEWMFGDDADLHIFVDKVCRSSDADCVRKIEADRVKSLEQIEEDDRNAKYIAACDDLAAASREGEAKHAPQEIAGWTRTCEQHPKGSYCQATDWAIHRERPDAPHLACANAAAQGDKTAPSATDARIADARPDVGPPPAAPNADNSDPCRSLTRARMADPYGGGDEIGRLTRACEQGADTTACESARDNIVRAYPRAQRLTCGRSQARTSAEPPPVQGRLQEVPSRAAGKWLVIAGAWPDRGKANDRLALLKGWGVAARIVRTEGFPNLTPGLFAVVLGPFAKDDATAELSQIKGYVADAFIKAGS
jgi:tetratricopeptide (TPR) repeat protein